MTQAGGLAPSPNESVREGFAQRAREWLSSGNSTQSRCAAVYLAQVRDESAVPFLIPALSSEFEGVRENALFALRKISNLQYPANEGLWSLWYDEELRWFQENRSQLERDLDCPNDAVVAAAILDISRHRLHRDELASCLQLSLKHTKPHLRALTCRSLQALGSPACVGALVECLQDPEEEVTLAACSALRTITSRDLDCQPASWADEITPE
jgi:hypothetical protein